MRARGLWFSARGVWLIVNQNIDLFYLAVIAYQIFISRNVAILAAILANKLE